MRGGSKPKANEIKRLEGNRRKIGRDHLPEEPQGIGRPRLPTHLSQDERRLWADVVGSLPVSLLTQADEAILERFAVAWATFREAHRLIKSTGLMIQSVVGPVRNPLLVVRNNAAREMHLAGSEIGLSPVARSRMISAGHEDDDPLALLLGDDGEDGAWATTSRTRN